MRTKKSTPYLFLAPYLILFLIFIIIPTIMAVGLSFTNYNAVQAPQFVGLTNYINLLTQDTIFLQYVLPNTILFSVIVGPLGYLLAFFLAWSLSRRLFRRLKSRRCLLQRRSRRTGTRLSSWV